MYVQVYILALSVCHPSKHMSIYICKAHAHTCEQHVLEHIYRYLYACICMYIYLYIYMYTCIYVFVYTHTNIYMYMYIYIYTYVYIYIYIYTENLKKWRGGKGVMAKF